MKQIVIANKVITRVGVLFLSVAACAALLSSCATAPQGPDGNGIYRFSVLYYKEPVGIKSWVVDPAQSANPEGAALNIITAMQRGDVDMWLASWYASERPTLSQDDRVALLEKWRSLKGGQISDLGRVVAGADLVIELSVLGPEQKTIKLQLPLRHSQDQWWLTSIDPASEFMNWETSTNTIVAQMETINVKRYLRTIQGAQ